MFNEWSNTKKHCSPVTDSTAFQSALLLGLPMSTQLQGALSLGAWCTGTQTVHSSHALDHTV